LAKSRNLFLQCHVDETTVEKMLVAYPGVRILWAHAGMSSAAATVGRLLDRSPMLWVELALRTDVAPDGTLDLEWRALFVRHPDRFMVGTDTWTTSRWESVRPATAAVQRWLLQLPRDVAEDRLEERRAPLSSALRRRSESRDQLEVGIVAQPRPRVGRIGPQHLVHLVVVLADLLERPHEIPAYRFSDALAVALKPVGHRLQLAHDLALPAGFFAHLAQGGVG